MNSAFKDALTGTVKFLLSPFTSAYPALEIVGGNGFYTTGGSIHIGTDDRLIGMGKTFREKLNILLGAVYHESAHCCFFEMSEFAAFIRDMDHPAIDMSLVTEDYDRDEVDAFLTDIPENTQIISRLYHGFMNIIRDVHDENSLIAHYGMMVERPITAVRTAMKREFSSYEEYREKTEDSPMGNFSLVLDLILYFTRFEELNVERNESLRDPICVSVLSLRSIIDEATGTDNCQEQIACITVIIARLWSYVRPQEPDEREPSGEQQNSGEKHSESEPQATGEQPSHEERQQPGGMQQTPNGQQSQDDAQDVGEKPGNGPKTYGDAQCSDELQGIDERKFGNGQARREQLEKIIEEAIGKIAEEKSDIPDRSGKSMASANAKERAENAEKLLRKAVNASISEMEAEEAIAEAKAAALAAVETADGNRIEYRPCFFSNEKGYRDSYDRVKSVIRSAVRIIKDALKEENGSRIYGRSRGDFSVKSLPKSELTGSGRAFETYKIPDEIPEMAIGVLIDHSGSMFGQKIMTAQCMAVMLYEIALELGIRIHIAGFNSDNSTGKTQYIEYVGFEDYRRSSQRYKLGCMAYSVDLCNRDGAAIRAITKVLGARPEKRKVCYILSDGYPSAYSYYEDGKADITAAIREAQKQDIAVIGCAIDEISAIREIYGSGNNFLDMTELEKIPKKMARQLERLILD